MSEAEWQDMYERRLALLPKEAAWRAEWQWITYRGVNGLTRDEQAELTLNRLR